jgi:hypothetical protein
MPHCVTYRFFASRDERTSVEVRFDARTYRVEIPEEGPHPDWAQLAFQRCPNCTLSDGEAYCPAALALAQFMPQFETRISYEKAVVEVEMPTRTVVSKTTFQHGMAALIGLVMAASGCPRTRFLRPMARTHLPFATDQETVFRALAVHLLGQYVSSGKSGAAVSLSLSELKENYRELSKVNAAMAERIRAAIKRDAAVNAVIILESFALIAPDNIDYGFEDIQELFVVEED